MERMWWEDEAEALDAALSMLADWENPTRESTREKRDAETDSSGGASDEAKPQRAVKINMSRERQKKEKLQLQRLVAELQLELDRLQSKSSRRLPAQTSGASGRASALNQGLVVWENITRRQFHARRRAEAVNKRLRGLVRSHAAIAENLLISIRRAHLVEEEAEKLPLFKCPALSATFQSESFDQKLRDRLWSLYDQWQVPFSRFDRFQNINDEFFEARVIRDDSEEFAVDFFISRTYPFSSKRVEDEVWRQLLQLQFTEENFSLRSEATNFDDWATINYDIAQRSQGTVGTFCARMGNKKFRDNNGQLVLMTTMCGHPDPLGRGLCKAIVFDDNWIRIVDSSIGSKGSPMTSFQYVSRLRIRRRVSDFKDRSEAGLLKSFVNDIVKNSMRMSMENIERRLMLGPSHHMYDP